MPERSEQDVTAAIEGAVQTAFGIPPKAPPIARPAPVAAPVAAPTSAEGETSLLEADDIVEPEGDVIEVAEGAEPAPAIAEPEFEIEVNGQKEVVKGADKVKELLQKGLHYSRGSEEIARVRDQLMAQAQMQQQSNQFQVAALADIAALQQIDAQLEQFNKVDWATAIDSDFVGVMKLQEQRAALREAKNAKLQELNAKQQQFKQGQAQAASQMLVAEQALLLAKLPAWRNSDKASGEKQAIARSLVTDYGFQAGEVAGLMDHRMLLVARDAAKWQELQRSKTDRTKQLREAPPVSKPGAASAQLGTQNDKAAFAKFTQEYKRQGQKGNHRAQEEALTKVFNRTFK